MRLIYAASLDMIPKARAHVIPNQTLLLVPSDWKEQPEGCRVLTVSDIPVAPDLDIQLIRWFKTWARETQVDGVSLDNRYSTGGIALWPLVEYWLFDRRFYAWSVRKILRSVERAFTVMDREGVTEIVLVGPLDAAAQALRSVAALRNVPVVTVPGAVISRHKVAILKRELLPHAIDWFKRLKSMGRMFLSKFRRAEQIGGTDSRPAVLLMSQAGNWLPVIDLERGGTKRQEQMIGGVVAQLMSDPSLRITAVDYDMTPSLGLNHLRQYRTPYRAAESFSSVRNHLQSLVWTVQLRREWHRLKHQAVFREVCRYKGLDVWPLVERVLRHAFYYRLPEAVQAAQDALSVIEHVRPQVVVVTDEGNRIARSLMAAARQSGAATVALQHGALNLSYWHTAWEVERAFSGPPEGAYPMADVTLVFGKADKYRLVRECGYPSDRVVVTGQPRYDVLIKGQEVLNKHRIRQELEFDLHGPLILFASQPLPPSVNEPLFSCAAEAVRSLGKGELVFKLHPRESSSAPHEAVIRRTGVRGRALKEVNTHALLAASDVVITRHSTVAVEAMALDKPVILLNLTDEPDGVPYASEGGAYAVRDPERLVPLLQALLSGDDPLRESRKAFLSAHLESDGRATERVGLLVRNLAIRGN